MDISKLHTSHLSYLIYYGKTDAIKIDVSREILKRDEKIDYATIINLCCYGLTKDIAETAFDLLVHDESTTYKTYAKIRDYCNHKKNNPEIIDKCESIMLYHADADCEDLVSIYKFTGNQSHREMAMKKVCEDVLVTSINLWTIMQGDKNTSTEIAEKAKLKFATHSGTSLDDLEIQAYRSESHEESIFWQEALLNRVDIRSKYLTFLVEKGVTEEIKTKAQTLFDSEYHVYLRSISGYIL